MSDAVAANAAPGLLPLLPSKKRCSSDSSMRWNQYGHGHGGHLLFFRFCLLRWRHWLRERARSALRPVVVEDDLVRRHGRLVFIALRADLAYPGGWQGLRRGG